MAGNISKQKSNNVNEMTADIIKQSAADILSGKAGVEGLNAEAEARSARDDELQVQIDKKADKSNSNGGFVGGTGASATTGGAVGEKAQALNGGAVGNGAYTQSGGAVGNVAYAINGGAIGNCARAESGGAVGKNARAGSGFAGGAGARTQDESGMLIDAIQLGTGNNPNPKTLRVYDYELLDADGHIPNLCMPGKVDKVEGMGLSSNDYTDEDKQSLTAVIPENLKVLNNEMSEMSTAVSKLDEDISGKADKTYVDNQLSVKADSIGVEMGLDGKVDKVDGMGLSSNDYTNTDKRKMDMIEVTLNGGFAGGNIARVETGGAIGNNAYAFNGGAIGNNTDAAGGGAVGNGAETNDGGTVGNLARANDGGAIGKHAYAFNGGAIGNGAYASNGFAGGEGAKTVKLNIGVTPDGSEDITIEDIDAIQLGTGINQNEKTLQIYDYQLMDADGNIPNDRMPGKVDRVKIVDDYAAGALEYSFGEFCNGEARIDNITSLSLVFPDGVYPNDYISGLSFSVGDTAPEISYSGSGILNWVGTDCSVSDGLSVFAPKASMRYDIVFYYNGAQFVGLVNGFKPAAGNGVSA
ncbi:MAG: hypothetical protein J6N52_03740 [Clostridia bacterium]|nr:hypothetical protein [Clostridia bacterium]